MVVSSDCPQCGLRKTDRHVLNCSVSASSGRYTWRHDSILSELTKLIAPRLTASQIMYCELPGFRSPSEVIISLRPDIVVATNSHVNIVNSRQYKQTKYNNLQFLDSSNMHQSITVFTLEVTSLGLLDSSDFNAFLKLLVITALSIKVYRRLGEIALRCSYYIFCAPHKAWPINIRLPTFW